MSNIFEATSFSRGYIFYNENNGSSNPSKDNIWENLRKSEVAYGERVLSYFLTDSQRQKNRISKGASTLKKLGKNEKQKEMALLQAIDPDISIPHGRDEYIRIFNEIYRGKDEFIKIVNRLKNAIASTEKKLRAPSIIVNYPGYFASALRDNISKKINNNIDLFLADDDQLWSNLIQKSIEDGFAKLENAKETKNSAIFGVGEDYAGLGQLMNHNSFFKHLIESELQIDNVKKEIKKYIEENIQAIQGNINEETKEKARRKNLTVARVTKSMGLTEGRVRSVAGLLDEVVEASLAQQKINENNFLQSKSFTVGNRVNATDTINIITDIEVDISPILESLENSLNENKQFEIAISLKNFCDKWDDPKSLDKYFLVSTSNKLYSMSHNHSFSKQANVSDLREVLKNNFTSTGGGKYMTGTIDTMFTNSESTTRLINLVYNTMEGAFLHEKSNEVIEGIKQILAMAAASLIFSDYYNVGEEASSTLNMIHLFDLDNVYIPLSVILEGMAEAYEESSVEDPERYIRLSSFKTGSILYPSGSEDRYHIDAGENKNIREAFRKQRDDARRNAKFSINFVNNFREIISKIAIE